ncbi:hypothetical protein BV25DRAFT_1822610 [Artomyces pyxidatus]|uniref:Uncharacterized protein n=1 Tax=Artomyces pyxidatus TaxID=48021 RepID=A0ACB8T9J0_9AGAM|nr:hypothetical protein BV25DRAFT_1822610 [Artomyces pyxidatus]
MHYHFNSTYHGYVPSNYDQPQPRFLRRPIGISFAGIIIMFLTTFITSRAIRWHFRAVAREMRLIATQAQTHAKVDALRRELASISVVLAEMWVDNAVADVSAVQARRRGPGEIVIRNPESGIGYGGQKRQRIEGGGSVRR